MNLRRFLPIVLWVLTFARLSVAAPCCAGGGSFLSLLNEEEKRQMTLSFSSMGIEADAPADGSFPVTRLSGDNELRQRTEISWAELLTDRWQVGFNVPIARRIRERQGLTTSHVGLSDIQAMAAYEFLSEWNYSSWKPRGVFFARVTAPTGRAPWDAVEPFGTDSHGAGFWMFGAGVYFMKVSGNWDWFTWGNIQKGLATEVQVPFTYRLTPGWGANLGGSLGYSLGDARFGVTLSKIWEGDVEREGGVSGPIPGTAYASAALAVAYLLSPVVSLSLQYSDQLVLGGAKNAALGRGVGLILRTRWERD